MLPSRSHALIRTFTLLLLLWVGFDVGAHGILAADFGPIPPCGAATSVCGDSGVTPESAPAHCHCFCHAVSVGAVPPVRAEGLAAANAIVLAACTRVARNDRDPLDHPPQLNA